jgi:hypothetical protein
MNLQNSNLIKGKLCGAIFMLLCVFMFMPPAAHSSEVSNAYSKKVQVHLLEIVNNPTLDVSRWGIESNNILFEGSQKMMSEVEKQQFYKLAQISWSLNKISKEKNFKMNSFLREYYWGLLSAPKIEKKGKSAYYLALRTINSTIKQIRASRLDIKNYLGTLSDEELGTKLERPLSKISELTRLMNKRSQFLSKDYYYGTRPTHKTLFSDPEYFDLWSKHRSCLNTLFESNGPVGVLLNSGEYRIEKYKAEKEEININVKTPHYSPANMVLELAMSRGGISMPYDVQVRQFGKSQRRRLQSVIDQAQEAINSLEVEKELLIGNGRKHYVQYNDEEKELISKIFARSPKLFGLFSARFGLEEGSKLLVKSYRFYRDKRDVFSKEILLTSVMTIAAAFIPGPTVLYFGARAIRLGQVLYTGLLATQFSIITNHMIRFAPEKNIADSLHNLNPGNVFLDEHSGEVTTALWEGGLTAAFIGMGEVMGFLRVGESYIANSLTKFTKWGHSKTSWILSRKDGVDDIKSYLNALVNNVFGGKVRVIPPKILQSSESYNRAAHLIKSIEQDRTFQKKLSSIVAGVQRHKDKEIFLDTAVETVFRLADIASKTFQTTQGFKRAILKELDRLEGFAKTARSVEDKFRSYLTVSNTSPYFNIAKQVSQKEMEIITGPLNTKIKELVVEKVKRDLYKKLGKVEGKKLKKEVDNALMRAQLSPLANKYADDTKELAIEAVRKLLKNPQIKRELFKLKPLGSFEGYGMSQVSFYYEKILVVGEKIAENYSTIITQTGINIPEKIQKQILIALRKINNDPAGFFIDMMELNSVLSKILLNLRLEKKAEQLMLNPHLSARNTLNCSFH